MPDACRFMYLDWKRKREVTQKRKCGEDKRVRAEQNLSAVTPVHFLSSPGSGRGERRKSHVGEGDWASGSGSLPLICCTKQSHGQPHGGAGPVPTPAGKAMHWASRTHSVLEIMQTTIKIKS